jgi:hypothetical protein
MQDFFRDKLTRWNDKLEGWARDDKEIYSFVQNSPNQRRIVEDLHAAHAVHYSRERVRPKKDEVPSTSRVVSVLQERGFQVEIEKEKAIRFPVIEVVPKRKVVKITEGRPGAAPRSKISVLGKEYEFQNEEWPTSNSFSSFCKVEGTTILFNANESLLRSSKLHDADLRRLILGIWLITEKQPQRKRLQDKFYLLLKDIL